MAGAEALMDSRGVILFAHGSRDPLWRVAVEAVAAEIIARDARALVRCAYLEMSEPELADAAVDLIAAGARQIRVFPLFLGTGKHVREDLPILIAQLRAQHPDVPVQLMPAAGEHRRLTELLAEIAVA